MFRLIGLHAGPDISVQAASALADMSPGRSRRALRSLAAVNMLEHTTGERYRFHDLLRAFARERAEIEEPEADRAVAIRRELDWYLQTADAADRVLAPLRRHVPLDRSETGAWRALSFAEYDEAMSWCDAERANLVAALDQAVTTGADDVAWRLPVALVTYLYLRRHRTIRLTMTRTAVDAARRADDRYGYAWSLICLGGALEDLGGLEEAIGRYQQARAICREIGDRQGEGMSLENLASAHRAIGQEATALEFGRQALSIWTEIGDRRNEAITLCTLGEASLDLDRTSDAQKYFDRALPDAEEADRHSQGRALQGLATVALRRGDVAEAVATYERALALRRRLGDTLGEAESALHLGRTFASIGRTAEARTMLMAASAILDDLSDPSADAVRRELVALGPDAP